MEVSMNTVLIRETIHSLNQLYGYSVRHQKIKLIEFAEFFCDDFLRSDENKKLKAYMITHLSDIASTHCNVDDELWSAIYIAGFDNIVKTDDFSFEAFHKEFNLTKRTLYLYNEFNKRLRDYAPTDIYMKEFEELVKKFTSAPKFAPNPKYSGIYESILDNAGKSIESNISFVPVMINEDKFRVMYDDYIKTLANYSETIRSQLDKNDKIAFNISSYYLFESAEYNAVKTLFVTYQNEIIGFCVIIEYPHLCHENCVFAIDQFYIEEQYRGLGIGEMVAKKIFKMYGGKGVLDILTENIPARKFWNNIFEKYAYEVRVKELEDDNGKDKEVYTYTFYTCVKE